ncbi:Hypothetical predicted protein [Mytilus galloprovincialis]|uniref:DZIP3-like HEPN domain-containing protein n=1 Tax=Mytilus galloprovincialis TaxID=29158 RepID=A0A8B6DR72_MYTGA|nr:Hypothetical predicted protein [Mytilus galloprovincialis]
MMMSFFSGGQVKSTDFDSSLLYKLIRNTRNHKIAPPTSGWGTEPLPGDRSEADDIERIRFYRNKIAHNADFKISNKQFLKQWEDLSKAVNRLNQGAKRTEIESLKCTQFNGSQKNEIECMKKNIFRMKDEIHELQNELFSCQDEIKDIKDAVIDCRKDIEETNEKHIPHHIRKCQLRVLEDWKRQDIVFCDETQGYRETFEEANKYHIVTFIGGPGSGKTATARHIALLFKRLGWEVVPICKEEEILRYGNCHIRQVFLPFEYIIEEMSKLQKTKTAQYVSLVLCLVNNKQLSNENMPSNHVKKRIYNSCGLDRGTADRKIFDALSNIEGTFVMKIGHAYSFIHDSIYEAIAYHYGQKFPEQILEFMPSERKYEDIYRDETVRRELLTDKRVRESLEGKISQYVTHSIRLISWVVYYGHTRLLQEIVNHVLDHNDSTEIVLGSDIEEQARLLLLSVYNGDLCLIELMISFTAEDDLMQFYRDSRCLLQKGGFNLRSWNSNSNRLRELADTRNVLDSSKRSIYLECDGL